MESSVVKFISLNPKAKILITLFVELVVILKHLRLLRLTPTLAHSLLIELNSSESSKYSAVKIDSQVTTPKFMFTVKA